jgi:hypothetical protein
MMLGSTGSALLKDATDVRPRSARALLNHYTANVYVHQMPDSDRAAVDRLDAVPSGVAVASGVKTPES